MFDNDDEISIIDTALKIMYETPNASNVVFMPDEHPKIRKNNVLEVMSHLAVITEFDIEQMLKKIISLGKMKSIDSFGFTQDRGLVDVSMSGKSYDASYFIKNMRFRLIFYLQKDRMAIVARKINEFIPTFEELGYDQGFEDFLRSTSGLILFCGPANSGKSTSVAACIDYFNRFNNFHIVTLEDPIEYMHKNEMSTISQREIGRDVDDIVSGIKDALRQNADIIVAGEIRDSKTMDMVLQASESGHLVLTTLHASGVPDAVMRVLGLYSGEEANLARTRLATCLRAIIWQRLLSVGDFLEERRTLTYKKLISTQAVKSIIREDKITQLEAEVESQKMNRLDISS